MVSGLVLPLSKMSRCSPFPPLGYVWKGVCGEALVGLMIKVRLAFLALLILILLNVGFSGLYCLILCIMLIFILESWESSCHIVCNKGYNLRRFLPRKVQTIWSSSKCSNILFREDNGL